MARRRVVKPAVHHVLRKKPLHRRRKIAARKAAFAPARCEILHRDRLFGGPEVASDAVSLVPTDVADYVPGVGDGVSPAATAAGFNPTGGGASSGGPLGVGGVSRPGGSTVVSPAPEPQTWSLTISGLLTAGLALRLRRRRRAPTAA